MTTLTTRLLALAAVLALAAPVRAEKVTLNFSGIVTSVADGGFVPLNVQTGNTFTGSFSYDATVTPTAAGFYPLQMGALHVLVNGTQPFSIATDPGGFLVVGDNALTDGKPRDLFYAQLNASGFPPITEHGPLAYTGVVSLAADKNLGALTSNALASLKLDLSKFDQRTLELAGGDTAGSGFWQFRGEILSLQGQEAPEPGSLALLALGGAGLAAYRWRRQRTMTSKRSG